MVNDRVLLVCCSSPVFCRTAHERLHGLPCIQAQGRCLSCSIQYNDTYVPVFFVIS